MNVVSSWVIFFSIIGFLYVVIFILQKRTENSLDDEIKRVGFVHSNMLAQPVFFEVDAKFKNYMPDEFEKYKDSSIDLKEKVELAFEFSVLMFYLSRTLDTYSPSHVINEGGWKALIDLYKVQVRENEEKRHNIFKKENEDYSVHLIDSRNSICHEPFYIMDNKPEVLAVFLELTSRYIINPLTKHGTDYSEQKSREIYINDILVKHIQAAYGNDFLK